MQGHAIAAYWRRAMSVRNLRYQFRILSDSVKRTILLALRPGVILLARAYRLTVLRRVRIICVTGSGGKTTTKDLIAAALSSQLSGRKSLANNNCSINAIIRILLSAKASHQFCVQELAGADHARVVDLDSLLRILNPNVSVFLNVASEHLNAFGSLEAIANHKGKLVAALPADGVAVLNADDPNVMAQRRRSKGRVMTFGLSPEADVRAEDVVSAWPECLRFTLVCNGHRFPVRTSVHGKHFVHDYLACFAVCGAMNVDLNVAIEAVRTVTAPGKRMREIRTERGATLIRDDFKAPVWSLHSTMTFLADAVAPRKIAVIGRLSEISGRRNHWWYGWVAKNALEVADAVVFVGPTASFVPRAAITHGGSKLLKSYVSTEQACEFLMQYLRPGDLALFKGPGLHEAQLSALVNARDAQVARLEMKEDVVASASIRPQVVVFGLGNPGQRYEGTPHNIGWRVVDCISRAMNAQWTFDASVAAARIRWSDADLHLVKAQSMINESGSAIADYCVKFGIPVQNLVVVHDDVSLTLGTVRPRLRGSDGGHKGLRSVLSSLRTDDIRRVKVGVDSPRKSMDLVEYVLMPFPREASSQVEQACSEAARYALAALHRVLEGQGRHSARVGVSDSALRNWADLDESHSHAWDGSVKALIARFQAEAVPRKKLTAQAVCERRIPTILEKFGNLPVHSIQESEIAEFLNVQSPQDALEYQIVLSSLFKSGLRWGWATRNPAATSMSPSAGR